MTVIVRKAQFQAIIGAGNPGGNQDIVIPGFGTVAAAVFALTKATGNTGIPATGNAGYFIGYTDMTNTCSFSYFEEDNSVGSNTLRRSSNNSVIGVLDDIGIESIAELVGPVTDGLRIRWSANLAAQYYFSVTLWGGVQAQCGDWTQPAGDGATFKITLPFEMDVMYVAGTGYPINNIATSHAQISEGIIVNNRPGISQTAYCQTSEDIKAQTALAGAMYQNLSAINHRLAATRISRASFANLIESDGVTMETSPIGFDDFSNELGYLAIGLNGEAQAHLLTTETPNVIGLETYTQPGFKPQYLDGIYTRIVNINQSYANNDVAIRSRRFVDESGDVSQAFSSQDNVSTTITYSHAHGSELFIPQANGVVSGHEASLTEFNASGWIDNYTKTTDRWFFILSIEEAAAPGPINGALDVTFDDMTADAIGAVDIDGALATTLADMVLAGLGTVVSPETTGTLDVTFADMALDGVAGVAIAGALDAAFEAMVLAGVGTSANTGELDALLEDMVMAALGALDVSGALDLTFEDATLEGLSQSGSSAALDVTLADAILEGQATNEIRGQLAATLADMLLAGVGTSDETGELDVTFDDLTQAAAGRAEVSGASDVTLSPMGFVGAGEQVNDGILDVTFNDMILAGYGQDNDFSGALDVELASMTMLALGGAPTIATTLPPIIAATPTPLKIQSKTNPPKITGRPHGDTT